jgi:hypothetical protein
LDGGCARKSYFELSMFFSYTYLVAQTFNINCAKLISLRISVFCVLCIHDLFGTELAMIFSFHVGLTDSMMQRMHFFFLSVSVRHFLATGLPDLLI